MNWKKERLLWVSAERRLKCWATEREVKRKVRSRDVRFWREKRKRSFDWSWEVHFNSPLLFLRGCDGVLWVVANEERSPSSDSKALLSLSSIDVVFRQRFAFQLKAWDVVSPTVRVLRKDLRAPLTQTLSSDVSNEEVLNPHTNPFLSKRLLWIPSLFEMFAFCCCFCWQWWQSRTCCLMICEDVRPPESSSDVSDCPLNVDMSSLFVEFFENRSDEWVRDDESKDAVKLDVNQAFDDCRVPYTVGVDLMLFSTNCVHNRGV